MGVSERTSLTVSSSSGGEVPVVETWGLRGTGGEWRWRGGFGLLDPLLLLLLELIQQPIRVEAFTETQGLGTGSALKNVIQDHFPKIRTPGARTNGPPKAVEWTG
ncbi:hypothetical protein SADUNF_Sadunf05G0059700 [Salix dunnii]|uniref:Uncharacterized protein n=1 Tax=Salix dunnii TaxID=1413687 RepID=A0A835MYK2_9ROSI|nr:hypothetical protein SADUNF_Sadunf05G0059700 [Salix dunnii]